MDEQDDQRQRITDALVKLLALSVVIGLGVAVGAYFLITATGVPDAADSLPKSSQSPSSLPSVALDSGRPSASPSASESESEETKPSAPSTRKPPRRGLQLSAFPATVGPGERINLTGAWPGRDNVTLQVQRKEGGAWGDFAGVTATVRVGRFSTYVLTSREGPARFRMFDPSSGQASNPVIVTVG